MKHRFGVPDTANRIAVIGGLVSKAKQVEWPEGYDIRLYGSVHDEGSRDLQKLVASAKVGKIRFVVIVIGHAGHGIQVTLKRNRIPFILWNKGLGELAKEIPGIAGNFGVIKQVAQPELSLIQNDDQCIEELNNRHEEVMNDSTTEPADGERSGFIGHSTTNPEHFTLLEQPAPMLHDASQDHDTSTNSTNFTTPANSAPNLTLVHSASDLPEPNPVFDAVSFRRPPVPTNEDRLASLIQNNATETVEPIQGVATGGVPPYWDTAPLSFQEPRKPRPVPVWTEEEHVAAKAAAEQEGVSLPRIFNAFKYLMPNTTRTVGGLHKQLIKLYPGTIFTSLDISKPIAALYPGTIFTTLDISKPIADNSPGYIAETKTATNTEDMDMKETATLSEKIIQVLDSTKKPLNSVQIAKILKVKPQRVQSTIHSLKGQIQRVSGTGTHNDPFQYLPRNTKEAAVIDTSDSAAISNSVNNLRERVVAALLEHGDSSASELAEHTGFKYSAIRDALTKWLKQKDCVIQHIGGEGLKNDPFIYALKTNSNSVIATDTLTQKILKAITDNGGAATSSEVASALGIKPGKAGTYLGNMIGLKHPPITRLSGSGVPGDPYIYAPKHSAPKHNAPKHSARDAGSARDASTKTSAVVTAHRASATQPTQPTQPAFMISDTKGNALVFANDQETAVAGISEQGGWLWRRVKVKPVTTFQVVEDDE